jgi:hypothetical protein
MLFNRIQSKEFTEIVLHLWLHPDHLLFRQMDQLGWTKSFFSLLLLIQLFARSELHLASAENHVCHRNVNTRKALEGAACVEPIDQTN